MKKKKRGMGCLGIILVILIVLLLLFLLFIFAYIGFDNTSNNTEKDFDNKKQNSSTIEHIQPTENNQDEDEIQSESPNIPNTTMGQENALRQANDYLNFMSFSRKGLIEQLEFEGYSNEDATYAVDNCNANWSEQAVKHAKEYLDVMAFSRSSLIEQLEFDGFTHEEAVYGVEQNGY